MVKDSSIIYAQRKVNSPESASDLFRQFLECEPDREYFVVACLNIKNEPTNISIAHMGSINAAVVHTREILKTAILSNAASIIVCHTHPSGDPTPSPEDIEMTKKLSECCKIMSIDLIDHLILGHDKFSSLKVLGYV